MDLLRERPAKLFGRYLLPSVSATLVTSIYIIADTIMIGRGVGADALVALNLVLPLFSLLFAFGMLFGVGGGVLYSVAQGAGDGARARSAFSTALAAAAVTAAVLAVLATLFLRPLAFALGADGTNIGMVLEYGSYMAHFAPVFLFSTFLQAFVRNDRDPKRAMAAVLGGAVLNIIFDYIFIFHLGMGMAGGAAATVMGNTLTVLLLLTHFLSAGNGLRFSRKAVSRKMLGQILPCGAPSFLIEGAAGIITFSFNHQLLRYIGRGGVVIYSVIANCALVCMSLFNGVSQAAQPVLAANYGAKLYGRVYAVRRMGVLTVLAFGVLLASTAYWMPQVLIGLFVEPDAALLAEGVPVLRTYFPAFVPMGLNLFFSTYFQSVVRPAPSLTVTVLRGIALPLLFVLALPALFGGQAIWLAVPLTELATLVAGLVLLRRVRLA
ncbi:MATE family efflux transporter [Intestinibacillus massiliensis]|nr:MATE family efflux transporter [Intestinibacillus massiliensis]